MDNYIKGKTKYILASVMLALFISQTTGNTINLPIVGEFYKILTSKSEKSSHPKNFKKNIIFFHSSFDTIPSNKMDSIKRGDSLNNLAVDTFHFISSKDSLEAPVTYKAEDSMIFDIPNNKILLYGKQTNVKFADNELRAPSIEFDQRTNLITAFLKRDTAGKVISFPTFNQGDLKTVSDTIAFNMQTGRGLTKGTYTKQDEMFVYAEKIKKTD